MTKWKDPIAEAKREGWNEAIEAAAEAVLLDALSTHAYWETAVRAIRSLHKPTEESKT